MTAEISQTLDRGIRVLHVLASAPAGLTVTEVAAALQVNRTVVHRLVATLEMHALVRRGERGRLYVGLGAMQFAAAVQPVMRETATPVLRSLADALGATAHLTVADGDEAQALVVVEPSWTDFHVAYRVGARHPVGRGAAGKAILENAVASSAGELQAGALGVAAPLKVEGMRASVGIVTLQELDVAEVAPQVVEAARVLSERLR